MRVSQTNDLGVGWWRRPQLHDAARGLAVRGRGPHRSLWVGGWGFARDTHQVAAGLGHRVTVLGTGSDGEYCNNTSKCQGIQEFI